MADLTLNTSQKASYMVTELPVGATIDPTDTTSVTSDNGAVEVVVDATPAAGSVASGFVFGRSVASGVSITATLTHADGSIQPLTVVKTVDVIAAPNPATGLDLTFGAPEAQ